MIFIQTDNNNTVTLIVTQPFDEKLGLGKSKEELLEEGYLVDSIPQPEHINGKSAILKYDGSRLYYEYLDRKLTLEEQLQQKNSELESALMEMSILSAQQEQRNKETEQAILELTTIIAGGFA